MDYDEYLRRVPKVELHCHFEGTVRPQTFAELAAKHGVQLSRSDPDQLYDYETIYEFLVIFGQVSSTLIDREDFARAAFESIEDGVRRGNLIYREMFFNPTLHTRRGVAYRTVVDGLIDGIERARSELGVTCRLIADVYRQDSATQAADMVREVLSERRDEVIGLGMDGAEAPDPPEKFREAYALAKQGGLRLTAHACEDAPARNITTCLDILGCERLDHGYHILEDAEIVRRVRDEGIVLSTCPTATSVCYFTDDYSQHPIVAMAEQGLAITLNSDDPPMFGTDIGEEFARMVPAAGWEPAYVRTLCETAVGAAWVSDEERVALRDRVTAELDALDAELNLDERRP